MPGGSPSPRHQMAAEAAAAGPPPLRALLSLSFFSDACADALCAVGVTSVLTVAAAPSADAFCGLVTGALASLGRADVPQPLQAELRELWVLAAGASAAYARRAALLLRYCPPASPHEPALAAGPAPTAAPGAPTPSRAKRARLAPAATTILAPGPAERTLRLLENDRRGQAVDRLRGVLARAGAHALLPLQAAATGEHRDQVLHAVLS